MDQARLKAELTRDEGRRAVAYTDSLGFWTVGIGHLIGDQRRIISLTEHEIDAFYAVDVAQAEDLTRHVFYNFGVLSDVRQRALVNMCFNLGDRIFSFKKFIAAVNTRDWEAAAREMLDSKWATQVNDRAQRLAQMVRLNVAQ